MNVIHIVLVLKMVLGILAVGDLDKAIKGSWRWRGYLRKMTTIEIVMYRKGGSR
jgi:UDP-N-acetylmuramyl pentapeptide phosphotransferase/UDP-N-acetylglucosamine-1-phosphate transferase